MATGRARRALQHRRACLHRDAGGDRHLAVRLHTTDDGALWHPRSDRPHSRKPFHLRRGVGGDRCLLWAEGLVRQDIAYGENLSLLRRYESELGGSSFRMVDVVTNDGWFPTYHQQLYHMNAGFPIVDDGSEVLASTLREPDTMNFSTEEQTAAEGAVSLWRTATAPRPGFTHEGYVVEMRPDEKGWVSVAIVNRRLRPELGGLGVYLRYDATALPVYIGWRMMREGLYALGMEPATNPFGNPKDLVEQGFPLIMQPGDRRRYEIEYGILVGADAIESFESALPKNS